MFRTGMFFAWILLLAGTVLPSSIDQGLIDSMVRYSNVEHYGGREVVENRYRYLLPRLADFCGTPAKNVVENIRTLYNRLHRGGVPRELLWLTEQLQRFQKKKKLEIKSAARGRVAARMSPAESAALLEGNAPPEFTNPKINCASLWKAFGDVVLENDPAATYNTVIKRWESAYWESAY